MERARRVRPAATSLVLLALLVACDGAAGPAPPAAPPTAPPPVAPARSRAPAPEPSTVEPAPDTPPAAGWLAWLDEGTSPDDATLAALREIGAPAAAAIAKRLADPAATSDQRYEGFSALAEIGPAARDAVISLCHAASADLRGDAVDKLRFVCAKGGADVADEIDRLLDAADVSYAAAEALA